MLRKNSGLTLLEVLILVVIIALLAVFVLPALTSPNYGGSRRAGCANNLKQFGLSLKMYAMESKGGHYPPLQVEITPPEKINPDNPNVKNRDRFTYTFTPRIYSIYPEYMSDVKVLICPNDPDNPLALIDDLTCVLYDNTWDVNSMNPDITQGCRDDMDDSYFYLNWVFDKFEPTDPVTPHPPTLLNNSFKTTGQTVDFTVLTADSNDPIWLPAQLTGTLTAVQNQSWIYMSYALRGLDNGYENFIDPWDNDIKLDATSIEDFDSKVLYGNRETNTVMHLREGIERFMTTDTSPGSYAQMQSSIPLMMDHPVVNIDSYNHVQGGSNVLFLDGHVEFIKHNAEAPVNSGVGRIIETIKNHNFSGGP